VAESVSSKPLDLPARDRSSYGQILWSSVLIGGTSLINVAIGIVRTKVFAVLLGPAGFGQMAAYTSVAEVIRAMAGMGVTQSGVRQIAEAVGTEDTARIDRTITVLRRVVVLLGIIGAVLLMLFSGPIAKLTFGSTDGYAIGMMLLAAVVFLNTVAGGQAALLQGMRRIGDLAKIGVIGSLAGTAVAIPCVYLLREDGVVPALIAAAAVGTLASWWYSRRVRTQTLHLSVSEVWTGALSLVRLGFAFIVTGLLMMGAAYAVRIIVLRHSGLESAGLYQAAWTLGGLYVGFILQAMGTDFYPRLVARVNDHTECNTLVNEQAHVSILLAGPGVIATLVLSPLLLDLFYSSHFAGAAQALRWTCLGMALRVVTWPMGFVIVAKNRQIVCVLIDLVWATVNVLLSWFLVDRFGLTGAGMAFFGAYVLHAFIVYPVVRRMSGFSWSRENRRSIAVFIAFGAGAFLLSYLPASWGLVLGLAALALSCIYSIDRLLDLVDSNQLPRQMLRVLQFMRVRRVARRA
jgi:enterobacterial common antigen flippase